MSDPQIPQRPEETSIASDDGSEMAAQTGENVIPLEPPRAPLTPEARRALEEAEARRKALDDAEAARAREIGGREGPDPVRYGDWETGGICSDF